MKSLKADLQKPHIYIEGVAINTSVAKESTNMYEAIKEVDKILSKGCVWPSDYQTIGMMARNIIKNIENNAR